MIRFATCLIACLIATPAAATRMSVTCQNNWHFAYDENKRRDSIFLQVQMDWCGGEPGRGRAVTLDIKVVGPKPAPKIARVDFFTDDIFDRTWKHGYVFGDQSNVGLVGGGYDDPYHWQGGTELLAGDVELFGHLAFVEMDLRGEMNGETWTLDFGDSYFASLDGSLNYPRWPRTYRLSRITPEPSTFAMLALGVLVFLIFRGHGKGIWKEFLFAVQRQPDGKWLRNETWGTLTLLWIVRISLVSMVVGLFVLGLDSVLRGS